MFLSIKQISKSQKLSQLSVVENSGHVVNVDQPIEFNNRAISFIRSL